jgi:hypothetical protein
MKNPGSFVCAALPSIIQHVDSVIKYHPGYIDGESTNKFFLENCDKFLSSIGIAFGSKKQSISTKVLDRYQKIFDSFLEKDYLKNCEFIIDSAGFQIQTGQLKKEDTSPFIELYHTFLEKNYERFKYAFTLDIAPGATDSVYDSWEELEHYNRVSYTRSAMLPEEVRRKMLYIHHFRTPKINDIYKRLLFEEGLGDNFYNFATGGLVSFSKSSQKFPCVLYIVPLIHLLTRAKQRGLEKFRFHVLGASEFKDILFHKFVEYHIKKVHNIDVEITYDSSTLFKVLMLGRYIYVLDDNKIWKMTLRENLLHNQWRQKGSIEEVWYNLLGNISRDYGFKILDSNSDPIYQDNIITRIMYTYGIFQTLQLFSLVDNLSVDMVKGLYELYESGQINVFDNKIESAMMDFNCGKVSKRIETRTVSIYNSLKALEELDLDYCDYLVNTYMAADECHKLSGGSITCF